MGDPNSCKPPLIKIWTVFNYTTRFKLYHNAFLLSLILKTIWVCKVLLQIVCYRLNQLNERCTCLSLIGNKQEMSKLRHITTPHIPTRYIHLVSCFGTRWVLTSISDHLAVQKAEPLHKVRVNPCMSSHAGTPMWLKVCVSCWGTSTKEGQTSIPDGTIDPVTETLTLLNTSATGQVMRLLSSCWGTRINQRNGQHPLSFDFIRGWITTGKALGAWLSLNEALFSMFANCGI